MEPDVIPAVDGDDAARQLQAARAETVVVLAGGSLVPGPEAEMVAMAAANQGNAAYCVGWRRARPEELVAGYRGMWDGGDLEGLGEPWWWRQRAPIGVGDLSQHDADFAAYQDRWAQAQADAARSAG